MGKRWAGWKSVREVKEHQRLGTRVRLGAGGNICHCEVFTHWILCGSLGGGGDVKRSAVNLVDISPSFTSDHCEDVRLNDGLGSRWFDIKV